MDMFYNKCALFFFQCNFLLMCEPATRFTQFQPQIAGRFSCTIRDTAILH